MQSFSEKKTEKNCIFRGLFFCIFDRSYFVRTLRHFFLTVGQNNFGNKILLKTHSRVTCLFCATNCPFLSLRKVENCDVFEKKPTWGIFFPYWNLLFFSVCVYECLQKKTAFGVIGMYTLLRLTHKHQILGKENSAMIGINTCLK